MFSKYVEMIIKYENCLLFKKYIQKIIDNNEKEFI